MTWRRAPRWGETAREVRGGIQHELPWQDAARARARSAAPDPAALLRSARRAAGLSQRDVAESMGVSPGTIGNWEAGRCDPPIGRFLAAMAVCGCTLLGRDADRRELREHASDRLRNRGGRRYPAHVTVHPVGPSGAGWYGIDERQDPESAPEWTYDLSLNALARRRCRNARRWRALHFKELRERRRARLRRAITRRLRDHEYDVDEWDERDWRPPPRGGPDPTEPGPLREAS